MFGFSNHFHRLAYFREAPMLFEQYAASDFLCSLAAGSRISVQRCIYNLESRTASCNGCLSKLRNARELLIAQAQQLHQDRISEKLAPHHPPESYVAPILKLFYLYANGYSLSCFLASESASTVKVASNQKPRRRQTSGSEAPSALACSGRLPKCCPEASVSPRRRRPLQTPPLGKASKAESRRRRDASSQLLLDVSSPTAAISRDEAIEQLAETLTKSHGSFLATCQPLTPEQRRRKRRAVIGTCRHCRTKNVELMAWELGKSCYALYKTGKIQV